MRFAYHREKNILTVTLLEAAPVLQQAVINTDNNIVVDIDAKGQVCALHITDPAHPWKCSDILYQYPSLSIDQAFFITVISEHRVMFQDLSRGIS